VRRDRGVFNGGNQAGEPGQVQDVGQGLLGAGQGEFGAEASGMFVGAHEDLQADGVAEGYSRAVQHDPGPEDQVGADLFPKPVGAGQV
jgi:hypothetical protein